MEAVEEEEKAGYSCEIREWKINERIKKNNVLKSRQDRLFAREGGEKLLTDEEIQSILSPEPMIDDEDRQWLLDFMLKAIEENENGG